MKKKRRRRRRDWHLCTGKKKKNSSTTISTTATTADDNKHAPSLQIIFSPSLLCLPFFSFCMQNVSNSRSATNENN
jgi:hypothetical protein